MTHQPEIAPLSPSLRPSWLATSMCPRTLSATADGLTPAHEIHICFVIRRQAQVLTGRWHAR